MIADCSAGTSPCKPGFTFNADQFTSCVAALKALSCPDFLAIQTNGAPAACDAVCT